MKQFIYNEMMVHVPVCTHKAPQNVLIISNEAGGFVQQIQKYTEDISCDVISADLDLLRDTAEKCYDIVISELAADAVVLAHINRVLKEDGLFVTTHPSLDDTKTNKNMMEIISKYAKIVMPYNLGNCSTALFASKAYHPTADIILQRADLIDGLEYYNSDIHIAAFAMGNNVRKIYLGIIKN